MTLFSSSKFPSIEKLARSLFERCGKYADSAIIPDKFKHVQLVKQLEAFQESGLFKLEPVGKSAEGRTINLVRYGNGKIKVLLWSQMHGDEPTATLALMEIFKFFQTEPDDEIVQKIKSQCELFILPMLNPDGAERFQRRNAQEIDINRDALALQTIEARILKETRDRFNPEFGFNLHDQDIRSTVGDSTNIAAISLLAPAFNPARDDNAVRNKAKAVACVFIQALNCFIPENIGKYDDAFEPRAFGDNIQSSGTSTMLVESGGWHNDPSKQFIRKLNFVGILSSLYAIANELIEKINTKSYDDLKFNSLKLYDLIIRNATLRADSAASPLKVDIALNIESEYLPDNSIKQIYRVMDIGDLRFFKGFQELDLAGQILNHINIKVTRILNLNEVNELFPHK